MKWGVINKSLWLGYKPIICEKCNTEYKISFSSRGLVSIFIVAPMVFFGTFFLIYFHLNNFLTILFLISISIFFFIVFTFYG